MPFWAKTSDYLANEVPTTIDLNMNYRTLTIRLHAFTDTSRITAYGGSSARCICSMQFAFHLQQPCFLLHLQFTLYFAFRAYA
ncbi:hypothetical protein L596_021658 [Steinernema carpocapsae]|uniref:Uncharacterized protein n=1 Tax=Steinernema carpocapsae TaxID=34508 RepID=A0A4U5MJE3_STECR|nr:hypothetical protein L596_021658 [Steinernema carpocapsae]